MLQERINNLTPLKERRRSLRRQMPKAEVLMWSRLKSKQLDGFKFRRQHSVGSYILDFYCPELNLAIELDGDTHAGKQAENYDQKRQQYIELFGIRLIRFTNFQVIENMEGVLQEILKQLPPPTPPLQEGRLGGVIPNSYIP